jgi:hypothetical protein
VKKKKDHEEFKQMHPAEEGLPWFL